MLSISSLMMREDQDEKLFTFRHPQTQSGAAFFTANHLGFFFFASLPFHEVHHPPVKHVGGIYYMTRGEVGIFYVFDVCHFNRMAHTFSTQQRFFGN